MKKLVFLCTAVLLSAVGVRGQGRCDYGSARKVFLLDTASVSINAVGNYRIYQTGAVTANTITLPPASFCVDILIENVNISSFRTPVHIHKFTHPNPNASNNRVVYLTFTGKNIMVSQADGNAAIQIDGIETSLHLYGSSADTLIVTGGKYAAGIGSGNSIAGGYIDIKGGIIVANGGADAADIGVSALQLAGSVSITQGAIVTAPFIGGTRNNSSSYVTIDSASVKTYVAIGNGSKAMCRIPNQGGIDSVIIDDTVAFRLGANHIGDNDLYLHLLKQGGTSSNPDPHTVTTVLKDGRRNTYKASFMHNNNGKWFVYDFNDYEYSFISHTYNGQCPGWDEVAAILRPQSGKSVPPLTAEKPEATIDCNSANFLEGSIPQSFTIRGIDAFGPMKELWFRVDEAYAESKYVNSTFAGDVIKIVDTARWHKVAIAGNETDADGGLKRINMTLKPQYSGMGMSVPNVYYKNIKFGNDYNQITSAPPFNIGRYEVFGDISDFLSQNFFSFGGKFTIDTLSITHPDWDTVPCETGQPLSGVTTLAGAGWGWTNNTTRVSCTGVNFYPVYNTHSGDHSVYAVLGISRNGSRYDLSACSHLRITTGGTYYIYQSGKQTANRIVVDCPTDSVTLVLENLNVVYDGIDPIIEAGPNGARVGIVFKGSNTLKRINPNAQYTAIRPVGAQTRVSLFGKFDPAAPDNDMLSIDDKASARGTDASGTLIINGGIVTAQAAKSAGLGCGNGSECEGIIINNGLVTAASDTGAGIGSGSIVGGNMSHCKRVVINGGFVRASSVRGAGIGVGVTGQFDSIFINGGLVTAKTSNPFGRTIGDIYGSGDIRINGGSVKAVNGGSNGQNDINPPPRNKAGAQVYPVAPLVEPNVQGVYVNGKPYNIWSNYIHNEERDTLWLYLPHATAAHDTAQVDLLTRQGRGVVRRMAVFRGNKFEFISRQAKNSSSRRPTHLEMTASPQLNNVRYDQSYHSVDITATVTAAAPLPAADNPYTAKFNEYLIKFKDSILFRASVPDNDSLPPPNFSASASLLGLTEGIPYALTIEYGGSFLNSPCRIDTVIRHNCDATYNPTPPLTATYGDTLKILLPALNTNRRDQHDIWRWRFPDDLVGAAGARQHRAYFSHEPPSAEHRCTLWPDTLLTVMVGKAPTPDFAMPPAIVAHYGDTLRSLPLAPHWEWTNPDSVLMQMGYFTMPARFVPADTNFWTKDTALNIVIYKAIPPHHPAQPLRARYGDTLKHIPFGDTICPDSCWRWNTPNAVIDYVGARTYLARFFTTLDTNFHVSVIDSMLLVIADKAAPPYHTPTLSAVYGDTLRRIALPLGWHWEADAPLLVGAAGARSHPAVFMYQPSPDSAIDTIHYQIIRTPLTISVSKKRPSPPIPELNATWSNLLRDISWGANNWRWKYPDQSVGGAGIRSHEAYYTEPDTANYFRLDTIIKINVSKLHLNVKEYYCTSPYCATTGQSSFCLGNPNEYIRPPNRDGAILLPEATEGDTLKIIPLNKNWRWLTPDSAVGVGTGQCHMAVFTPDSAHNIDTIIRALPMSVISLENRLCEFVGIDHARCGGNDPRRFVLDTCNLDSVAIRLHPFSSSDSIFYCIDTACVKREFRHPIEFKLDVLRPNEYALPFKVSFTDGRTFANTIFIERRFEFKDIVFQKQNKMFFINNNFATNNGYLFDPDPDKIEWYADGGRVGRGLYYFETETNGVSPLDSGRTARFHVRMTTLDGKTIGTCRGSSGAFNAAQDLLVYPNPATDGRLSIENIHYETDNEIKIYNVSNTLVQHYVVSGVRATVNISTLKAGAYVLTNGGRTAKFVVR